MENPSLPRRIERRAFSPAGSATLSLLIVAIAYLIAARWLVALTWDGSGYLFNSLQDGAPFIAHYRFSNYPSLWAVVKAGQWTHDSCLLAMFYGALLALTPLAALALSFWLLREPRLAALRVWPVLGILLAALPGEICLTSEATPAVQVCWPIVCFIFAGAPVTAAPWIALLSIYLFFLHPTSIALFLLCAVVTAYCGGPRRRVIAWVTTFSLLAVARTLFTWHFGTSYERTQLSLSANWQAFLGAILGMSLFLYAGLYLLAIVALLLGTNRIPSSVVQRRIWWAGVCLILAALIWAFYPRLWAGAISYRRFVLFCSLPVVALAVVHYRWLTRQKITQVTTRIIASRTAKLSLFAAVLFSVIYITQAFSWRLMLDRFEKALSKTSAPYVTLRELPWVQNTALEHWSSTALSAILQGRKPKTLFALDNKDIHGADVSLFPGRSLGVKDTWFLLGQRAAALRLDSVDHRGASPER